MDIIDGDGLDMEKVEAAYEKLLATLPVEELQQLLRCADEQHASEAIIAHLEQTIKARSNPN